MKKFVLLIFSGILILQIKAQTVTDVDGNIYNTVTIGTQVWMKENLKTTRYNDGAVIPYISDSKEWAALSSGAYCYYSNSIAYGSVYGHLYNYFAVIDSRKLCPSGWHIPSRYEWELLDTTLGITSSAGKMKSTTSDWKTPNYGATNESGFSALPGNERLFYGDFIPPGVNAFFWSSTEYSTGMVYAMQLIYYSMETQGNQSNNKRSGLSVRCIKDLNTSISNTINLAISIYPNPAKDKFYIDNIRYSDTYVIVCDLQGKQISSIQVGSNPIDISNLPRGIYIVKIIESEKIVVNKLIKE